MGKYAEMKSRRSRRHGLSFKGFSGGIELKFTDHPNSFSFTRTFSQGKLNWRFNKDGRFYLLENQVSKNSREIMASVEDYKEKDFDWEDGVLLHSTNPDRVSFVHKDFVRFGRKKIMIF